MTASSASEKYSDLAKRAIAGVILLMVAGGAIWLGGWAFLIFVGIAMVLIVWEWTDITSASSLIWVRPLAVLAVLGACLSSITGHWSYAALGLGLLSLTVGLLGWGSSNRPMLWAGLGVAYAGLPGLSLLWLRAQQNGFLIVLWIVGVVVATDTCAYFAGRKIGGPKLAPKISPKKTWAGLVGGMAGAAGVGAIVAMGFGLPISILVSLSAALAVVAQGADLAESAVKRVFGVKDSGAIIPGHGGVMDRADGLLGAAPLVALAILLNDGLVVLQ